MTPTEESGHRPDEDVVARVIAYEALLETASVERETDPSDVLAPHDRGRDRIRLLLKLLEAMEPGPGLGPVAGRGTQGETSDEGHPLLGRFEILDHLGSGGFGFVVRARDRLLGRDVALKMPLPERLLGSGDVGRFLKEARAAARLDHPNIVRVFDAGEIGLLGYFIASEFCAGPTLRRWLKAWGEPVAARLAARWVAALADAVQQAHDRGILHRDIKPDNVILAGGPGPDKFVPRLTDFGLAKLVEEAGDDTLSGARMGTPPYMAPEQAAGHRHEVGPATDVYALGATLYEVLTGRPPFRGESDADTLRLVLESEPVPPRSLRPGLPSDLETICLKCLRKEPARRYASAGAMCDDLERFLDGRSIRARRTGAAERFLRWCRRNPMLAGLAAGIALALVLGTLVSSYFALRAGQKAIEAQASARLADQEMRRANRAARIASEEARRAEEEARRATEQKRISDHRLYLSEMSLGQQAWQEGLTKLTQQHLRAHEPKRAEDPDPRGFEWYYLRRLCQLELRTMCGHLAPVRGVAFSPDGRRIASAGEDGNVRLWDAAGGHEVLILSGHTAPVKSVSFSPDGHRIASAGEDGSVRLWDAVTGRETLAVHGHHDQVYGVTFSPDGRRIASASEDGTVRLRDASTGQEVLSLRGHSERVHSGEFRQGQSQYRDAMGRIHSDRVNGVAFSSDGRRVAAAGWDGSVRLWDAATGRETLTLRGHAHEVHGVAFSPDGREVASASRDGTVKLWDTATGQEILTLEGHAGPVWGAAWSPDGRRIVSTSADRTVKLWDATSGKELLTLRGHAAGVWSAAFSPDGRRLASASNDQTVKLWDLTLDQERLTARGHMAAVWSVRFSPDGRQVASVGDDRTVRLWDVTTGQEVRTMHGHSAPVEGVAFSPDGRRIVSASWDRTIIFWDIPTGRAVLTLPGHSPFLRGVAFSPDGRRIASIADDLNVWIRDATTGQELLILRGPIFGALGLAISPDGRRIAAGGRSTVKVWDAAAGREILILPGRSDRILGLAFSTDSGRIAAAQEDGTVQLWDAATGGELLTLRGHASHVHGVAFSPDGRRIASASGDGTVKLWDATTGQEVLTLRGHTDEVNVVAFSPDGYRIASASADRTVMIWDATPLTTEQQVLREARGVVEFAFLQPRPEAELLARIRNDPTISDPVRRRALVLAESQGRSRVVQQAEHVVQSLFAKPMFRPDVLASLRTDSTLTEPVRREALALAERVSEDAWRLNGASWLVVRQAGAGAGAYHQALRQAEAACRLIPRHGGLIRTLGVARYRVGKYAEAVASLMEADQLNAPAHGGFSTPLDMAFLALAHNRLGQAEQARAALRRLRESMKEPVWLKNEEARTFLREAEALEQVLVFPADPFAP